MSTPALFAVDLLAIAVLVFALYLPRHRRTDLVVAYLGVNVGGSVDGDSATGLHANDEYTVGDLAGTVEASLAG